MPTPSRAKIKYLGPPHFHRRSVASRACLFLFLFLFRFFFCVSPCGSVYLSLSADQKQKQVGVRLFGDAFLSGKMPPHLRMAVGGLCDAGRPCHRKLHSGMSLEAKNETIASWIEHQNSLTL